MEVQPLSPKKKLRDLQLHVLWGKALRAPDPFLTERKTERRENTARLKSVVSLKSMTERNIKKQSEVSFLVTGKGVVETSELDRISLRKSVETRNKSTNYSGFVSTRPRHLMSLRKLPIAMSGFQTKAAMHKTGTRSVYVNRSIEKYLARFETPRAACIQFP